MGIARSALAVLAAGAVVTLLVVGVRALIGSLGAEAEPPAPSPAVEASQGRAPTVRIECLADACPTVTVRVPGGDVLQHREMTKGEEVSFFQPELAVVLTDAATVRVTENGKPRAPGGQGEREAFTTRGPGA